MRPLHVPRAKPGHNVPPLRFLVKIPLLSFWLRSPLLPPGPVAPDLGGAPAVVRGTGTGGASLTKGAVVEDMPGMRSCVGNDERARQHQLAGPEGSVVDEEAKCFIPRRRGIIRRLVVHLLVLPRRPAAASFPMCLPRQPVCSNNDVPAAGAEEVDVVRDVVLVLVSYGREQHAKHDDRDAIDRVALQPCWVILWPSELNGHP